jgi:hypothetical protein
MNGLFERLFESDYGGSQGGAETVLFTVCFAFVIGHFIGWVYMWTHKGLSYSQTFVASLVVIPVVVAMMMMLMQGSIAFAFGLLAVFAVVRFRNVLKDTRDTTFILWSIMQGLGVGTMRLSTSLIGALGVAAVLLYLRATAFGSRHRFDAVLSLQLSGDFGSMMVELKSILRQHCARTLLASQQRAAKDTANLSYRVLLRDPGRSNDLQKTLEDTEGISNVSLFLREDESEV